VISTNKNNHALIFTCITKKSFFFRYYW